RDDGGASITRRRHRHPRRLRCEQTLAVRGVAFHQRARLARRAHEQRMDRGRAPWRPGRYNAPGAVAVTIRTAPIGIARPPTRNASTKPNRTVIGVSRMSVGAAAALRCKMQPPAMPLNHYVTLGHSGLRVSPLCLGAMTFGEEWGWGSSVPESEAILA